MSAGIQFSYILHRNCEVRHCSLYEFHLLLFWLLLMENISFCGPSTWIFVFIKPSLLEESLSHKKIRNLLILCIVKNEAMLAINLCSIKLHELCEFDQNKNTCRITSISLFIKLNILNCFPSADITL